MNVGCPPRELGNLFMSMFRTRFVSMLFPGSSLDRKPDEIACEVALLGSVVMRDFWRRACFWRPSEFAGTRIRRSGPRHAGQD